MAWRSRSPPRSATKGQHDVHHHDHRTGARARRPGLRRGDRHAAVPVRSAAVRELAVGVGAAIVFPEYDRSPEARYPVAIQQNYAAAQWVVENGAAQLLDATRLAVAGDSVGGNMAAALTLMAKDRSGPKLAAQ